MLIGLTNFFHQIDGPFNHEVIDDSINRRNTKERLEDDIDYGLEQDLPAVELANEFDVAKKFELEHYHLLLCSISLRSELLIEEFFKVDSAEIQQSRSEL